MEENPLHKAHALSAKASLLLKPSTADAETLVHARDAYKEAAELFASALATQRGDEDRSTLKLLVNQHRKLTRDVERRLATSQRAAAQDTAQTTREQGFDMTSVPIGINAPDHALDHSGPSARPGTRRATTDRPAMSPRRESVGLASATNLWPAGISTRLGVPPFAFRPAGLTRDPSQATFTSPSTSPTRPTEQFAISPLNSSSSSDDSYLNLGAIPDTLDPFSRFWGMLENMLDDISNPVAFASAPLGIPSTLPEPSHRRSYAGRDRARRAGKGDGPQSSDHARDPSPAESFYVVHPSRRNRSPRTSSPAPDSPPLTTRAGSASGKTPEELALENENLRASLDEIASHAEELERANKVLKEQGEERDKAMRSIAVGVRREAHRVKHGQDMIRSQLIASMSQSSSAQMSGRRPPSIDMSVDGETALRARVRELEETVKRLQTDNEKQKAAAEKYKDKLHQIKTNARAKRDAKLAGGEGSSRSSLARKEALEE